MICHECGYEDHQPGANYCARCGYPLTSCCGCENEHERRDSDKCRFCTRNTTRNRKDLYQKVWGGESDALP